MMKQWGRGLFALVAACAVPVAPAGAQSWPNKPLRLVTGSQAGGGTDVTARSVQQAIGPALGVPVIVENRPGSAGMLANDYVARQPADGHVVVVQPGSFVTVSPLLNASPAWGTLRHLAPVIQISAYDFALVVHPSVPARTVGQLVALAKSRPGQVSFASSGVGSNFHLAGEMLRLEAGVDLLHVAYRGSPPAVIDLVAGRVDMMFVHIPTVRAHVDAGRLRAIATTGASRSALLPSTPTIAESGLKRYEIAGIEGVLAPAATPRETIARLNGIMGAALGSTELRAAWAARGIEFTPNTPEQFAARVKGDYDRTAALIRAADIRPER